MELSLYQSFLKSYKEKTISDFEHLENLLYPEFNSFIIDCNKIDELKADKYKLLKEKKINEESQYLYYFKIISKDYDLKKLTEDIAAYKDNVKKGKDGYLSLPEVHGHINSEYLYVGKCQGKCLKRLKVHLGFTEDGTFGLHLKKWFDLIKLDSNLQLQYFYANIPLESNQYHLLEMIETSLHISLKPILGREGS